MYRAKRSFSAGRDDNGKLIEFEAGKTYKEIPAKTSRYFDKVEKEVAKKQVETAMRKPKETR